MKVFVWRAAELRHVTAKDIAKAISECPSPILKLEVNTHDFDLLDKYKSDYQCSSMGGIAGCEVWCWTDLTPDPYKSPTYNGVSALNLIDDKPSVEKVDTFAIKTLLASGKTDKEVRKLYKEQGIKISVGQIKRAASTNHKFMVGKRIVEKPKSVEELVVEDDNGDIIESLPVRRGRPVGSHNRPKADVKAVVEHRGRGKTKGSRKT